MRTLNASLVLALSLCACSGRNRTVHYAAGARDYIASPSSCSLGDNPNGALTVLADDYHSKDGKGIVFDAVKPGKARIECKESSSSVTVEVHEPAKLELQRGDGSHATFKIGDYAPTFCLRVFDKDGTALELGTLLEGAQFEWSEQVNRVVDHGMGGPGNASCAPQGMGHAEGKGTISATWRGMSAKADFEVKGTSY